MNLFRPRRRVHRRTLTTWAVSFTIGVLLSTLPAPATEPVTDFGENPGALNMYLHLPADHRAELPLVVALHGCQQSATGFDDETGLVALSEETPFVLLLPEQQEDNMSRRCFRWYDRDDNRAGHGESASILAMIDHVIAREDVDPDRVFVLGLSAGGAMTAVLLANYPDRFAGGAILAGLPYGCNRPVSAFDATWYWLHYNPFVPDGADASYACGIAGFGPTDRDAADWAAFVRDAASAPPDRWPLLSLWQGTSDETVDPDNLRELTEQWTSVHGIDSAADAQEAFAEAVRELYQDDTGAPRLETWTIRGFSHAFPIDADGDPALCGVEAEFVLDAGICAARRIADFWQLR